MSRLKGNKRLMPGLIRHSDLGSQYCSPDYRKLVKQFGIQPSTSRVETAP